MDELASGSERTESDGADIADRIDEAGRTRRAALEVNGHERLARTSSISDTN